jgi:hypothetical protein
MEAIHHNGNEGTCKKIKSACPDIGEAGIDLEVDFDKDQDSLVVI